MNTQVKFFWTVWAFGWWRLKSFNNKTIETRIFIGPMVITRW